MANAPSGQLDALVRSDREYEFETWLEDHGVDDAWEIAPALVKRGYHPLLAIAAGTGDVLMSRLRRPHAAMRASELESLAVSFSSEQLPAVAGWLNSSFTVHNVMAEVRASPLLRRQRQTMAHNLARWTARMLNESRR